MKTFKNIIIYITSFFLLAKTIYRTAFYLPPSPQDDGYLMFWCCAVGLSVVLSGLIVGLIIYIEYSKK